MVNRQEIMACESVDMVRFDLGTLLQGQMRIAKIESAYNSLIIGDRDLGWYFCTALFLIIILSSNHPIGNYWLGIFWYGQI